MKVMYVVAGIVATGAIIYEPKLLVVAAMMALVAVAVIAIGVFSHDNS